MQKKQLKVNIITSYNIIVIKVIKILQILILPNIIVCKYCMNCIPVSGIVSLFCYMCIDLEKEHLKENNIWYI